MKYLFLFARREAENDAPAGYLCIVEANISNSIIMQWPGKSALGPLSR